MRLRARGSLGSASRRESGWRDRVLEISHRSEFMGEDSTGNVHENDGAGRAVSMLKHRVVLGRWTKNGVQSQLAVFQYFKVARPGLLSCRPDLYAVGTDGQTDC